MIKERKVFLYFIFALALSFCAGPSIVCAQMVITEVMYDVEGTDSGREWIEIQNIGTENIDLY
jgi:hypothetical protein